MEKISQESIPPLLAFKVHELVKSHSGIFDPYLEAKKSSTQEALGLYPWLKELVQQSSDPLETAIRISIAGNIIDLGVHEEYADLKNLYVRNVH